MKLVFSYLMDLKFHDCHLPHLQSVFDNIWSLPKLIHCDISVSTSLRIYRFLPKKISASLECVILMRCLSTLNEIAELVQSIPRLTHLSITTRDFGIDYQLTLLPTLISLNIRISHLIGTFDNSSSLTKHASSTCLESRSSMEHHRWFVRCFVLQTTIHLCTLSNVLRNLRENLPDLFLSTCPDDNLQQGCNDIHQIWSIVPTLERLRSLTVCLTTDTCQSQMQTLLDRAPHISEMIMDPRQSRRSNTRIPPFVNLTPAASHIISLKRNQ